ncbi:MAG: nucleotidyltransferase family protein [Acidobacteriota bacterium]
MAEGQELPLLLLSGRLYLGSDRDEAALQCLRGPLNWSLLAEMASREGMSGLLALQLERLARAYSLDLPLEPFSQALRGIFIQNGRLFGELARLEGALRERDIRVILLKGGALIETCYHRQLGLRPLSDLDLLVRPPDVALVRHYLLERGFRTPSASSSFYTKGLAAFDLHTDLIGISRIRRRALAFAFDTEELWRNAIPLHGSHLLALSKSHQFLHLAVHALKHSFCRLISFVDLGLVGKDADWQDVLERARSSGTLRAMAYAVRSLEKLMAFEIPSLVRSALPPLNRMERIFLDGVTRRRSGAETLGETMLVFSIPGRAGKLAYLLEYFFPRRKVLAGSFSSRPAFLLYPRRLVQLTTRGLTQVGKLGLRLGLSMLAGLAGSRRPPRSLTPS